LKQSTINIEDIEKQKAWSARNKKHYIEEHKYVFLTLTNGRIELYELCMKKMKEEM